MKFNDLPVSRKLMVVFAGIGFVAVLIGATSIWSSSVVAQRGIEVGERLAPLGDAAMVIKLSTAQAHLTFEEVMSGEHGEDIEEVWALLENARFHADAILNGGQNDDGTIFPSDAPAVRKHMERLLNDIQVFGWAAKSRFAARSANHGASEQKDLDALYRDLTKKITIAARFAQEDAAIQSLVSQVRIGLAHGRMLSTEVLGGDGEAALAEAKISFTAAATALNNAAGQNSTFGTKVKGAAKDIDRMIALANESYEQFRVSASASVGAEHAFEATYELLIKTADEAEELIRDQMALGLDDLRRSQTMARIAPSVGVIALMVILAIAYRILGTQLGRRLRELSWTMNRLTQSDLDAEAPAWRSNDEIGQLRDSVDEFREALLRQAALEKAAETSRREANARANAASALNGKMAELVEAVNNGDLSARLSTNHGAEELDRQAEGVNQLVETVGTVMSEASKVMKAFSNADLTVRMEGDFKGDFALLRDSANGTSERLAELIAQVQSLTEKAREGAQLLEEGGRDLAVRTESQAASLKQTSTTMEEMSVRVKGNAERTVDAVDGARKAVERADEGQSVVTEAVASIREIEESSHKIADIITVIESIAFQTNLLALNAAVEAARAGDAGKGFAVVASEVRTLAQRSSEAAKDITTLIKDSSTKVGQGVELAEATGVALSGIKEVIVELAGAIHTISEENNELARSVQDVKVAVIELDGITQHNAMIADQSAATTREFDQVMAELTSASGAFIVSTEDSRANKRSAENMRAA